MKKEAVEKALERMSEGQYTGFSIGELTDKIGWLWKWRKISYEEMTRLTALARYILGDLSPDDEDYALVGTEDGSES